MGLLWPTWVSLGLFFVLLIAMSYRKYHGPRYIRLTASGAIFCLVFTLMGAQNIFSWFEVAVIAMLAVLVEYAVDRFLHKIMGINSDAQG